MEGKGQQKTPEGGASRGSFLYSTYTNLNKLLMHFVRRLRVAEA
jgi:hypothetical protein